jgi:LacI family transcriptional regulator
MPNDEQDQEKTTIYDVAEHAGVAISTVSRVLNNSQDVSDATRERVMGAIRELQFRPNRTAKSLAQRATRTIAVAVPTFTTPFHNELLKGVRDRLDDADVDLLLCDLDWEAPRKTLFNFLDRGAMDGLIVAGLPIDEETGEDLMSLGAPVVLIGSQWKPLDSFYWEEEPGVLEAMNHLLENGHRRIGMITTPHNNRLRNARVNGYKQALKKANLPYDDTLVVHGETRKHDGFSEESGYEAMNELLSLDDPVTAVFASSDVQAIGAWQAIREAGMEVPDDVSLVGYDDIKVSRFIGLTSVAQNMHYVGEKATDVLLSRLNNSGSDDPVSELVRPKLQIRKSSRSPSDL